MAVRLRDFAFRGISIVRPIFIETGTYEGETLDSERRAGFGELHSIEVHEPHYWAAQRRFAGIPHVQLHLGSSPLVLPLIIDPALATTFWLDAHFQCVSACEQDPRFGECPLLAELDVIRSFRWRISPLILIDDAYMFDHRIHSGFDRRQWPTTTEISKHLPPNFQMIEHDEILYCLPPGFVPIVDQNAN
jgi:hypothetical protein